MGNSETVRQYLALRYDVQKDSVSAFWKILHTLVGGQYIPSSIIP